MKERPILLKGPMVRAVLDGSKTNTRRIVKGTAAEWLAPGTGFTPEFVASPENHLSPYGFAGDRLWVRETLFAWGRWETRFSAQKKRDEWHFVDLTGECGHSYRYAADEQIVADRRSTGAVQWWKRPAIFMPRAACRIELEVTGVRIERLQAISRGDAMEEGCPFPNVAQGPDPRQWYADLWGQINGADSWTANPWVWVVGFKRLEEGG